MYIFGGLKSRDRDLAIELFNFLQRQLHSECNTTDYKKNWENRILSAFVYGYFLGFCKEASYKCVNTSSTNYRKKFVQYIFDKKKGNCGEIINKYIAATHRIRYVQEEGKELTENLRHGLEKFLPSVEMFCCGHYSGKIDLVSYVDRTNSELQLKNFMISGEYNKQDIGKKVFYSRLEFNYFK